MKKGASKNPTSSTKKVLLAVLLLVGAASIFGNSLYDTMFSGIPASSGPSGDTGDHDTPETVAEDRDDSDTTIRTSIRADLLAHFGSFASRTTVKNSLRFAPREFEVQRARARSTLEGGMGTVRSPSSGMPLQDPVRDPPAAPLAGSSTEDGAPPPPAMTVSLVMLTDRVGRAVVDGRVVGVGDHTTAGIVLGITKDGIEVEDPLRGVLYYEIHHPWPRGYAPPIEQADEVDQTARGNQGKNP